MIRLPSIRLLLVPAALVLAAAPAGGQALRVTVTDAGTGAPVEGAMVRVENDAGELVQAGFADRRGRLRLALGNAGRYAVGAERAGYVPRVETLSVRGGETAVALRLEPRPFALDTVAVVMYTGPERGQHTFERRRATGSGIYLDSAYVAQRRARFPGELLRSVPGIDVALVTGREGWRRPQSRMGRRCLVSLVNGLPYYGGWPRFLQLEETLRRADVIAIEVYREFSEVPPELRRYAHTNRRCGVIVYWTEDGWHSATRGAQTRN